MSFSKRSNDRLSKVKSAPLSSQAKQVIDDHRNELAESEPAKDDGLPAWMTSKTTVVTAMVICAMIISQIHVGSLNADSEKKRQTVREGSCLQMTSPPGSGRIRDWPEEEHRALRLNASRNSVMKFGEVCQPGDCSKKALKDYDWQLYVYLGDRVHSARYTYSHHGQNGVDLVNRFYATAQDYNIIMDARKKMKAGLLDVDKQGEPERSLVLRLLLANPSSAIAICRA